MLGSFIIFIIILTLNTVILAPRFLLFYLSTTVSPPSLTFIPCSHLPSTHPFTLVCLQSERLRSSMGVNKAWEIKLKNDQVSHPCLKTDLDTPLQGLFPKSQSMHRDKSTLTARDTTDKVTQLLPMIRVQLSSIQTPYYQYSPRVPTKSGQLSLWVSVSLTPS